ncbi:MAG: four helix bundle protein [Patescibacteria group bacterium]|nr:four helix bundle protein [Patescibacteria group bacterium]
MNQGNKIKSFTDLIAWKEGHKLVLIIYDITKNFPKEKIFGLISQMRRCVVSITSNIAEGFSRLSYKKKARFYSMALGSITELQNQLLIVKDIGYITKKQF